MIDTRGANVEVDRSVGRSGVACLVTMLRFHGIPVDPEQLIHNAAGQCFGLAEVVRGARSHGLKAKVKIVKAKHLCVSACNNDPLIGVIGVQN